MTQLCSPTPRTEAWGPDGGAPSGAPRLRSSAEQLPDPTRDAHTLLVPAPHSRSFGRKEGSPPPNHPIWKAPPSLCTWGEGLAPIAWRTEPGTVRARTMGVWGKGLGPDAPMPLHKMLRAASSAASLPPRTGPDLRGPSCVELSRNLTPGLLFQSRSKRKKSLPGCIRPLEAAACHNTPWSPFRSQQRVNDLFGTGLEGTSGWHWHGLPAISTNARNDAQMLMLLPQLTWASLPHWLLWMGTAGPERLPWGSTSP